MKYFDKDFFSNFIKNIDPDESPKVVDDFIEDDSLINHLMNNFSPVVSVKVSKKEKKKKISGFNYDYGYENIGNITFVKETGVYELKNCNVEYNYGKYSANAVYILKKWCSKEMEDLVVNMNQNLLTSFCELVKNYLMSKYDISILEHQNHKNIFQLKY